MFVFFTFPPPPVVDTIILQHCDQKKCLKWFQFLEIYQGLICGPGRGLSWRIFLVQLRKSMYHSFFIHSSVYGHLVCFFVLANVNSATVNIGFSSVSQSCLTLATPWTAVHQASLSITSSWSLLKLLSIELVMPSNHFIFCHPLLLPSVFPSVFSNESIFCIRWPKCWSFSFSISPSNEYSGLICFRMDWLDLLAVQGTL